MSRGYYDRDPHRPYVRSAGRACYGKIAHASKKQARGVLRVMLRDAVPSATRLMVYHCHVCRHWHLGNSSVTRHPPTLLEQQMAAVLQPFINGILTP